MYKSTAAFLTWKEKIRAVDPNYIANEEQRGGSDVHRAVIEWLKGRKLGWVSEYLRYLRRERNKADYDLNVYFSHHHVHNLINIAHELVKQK